MIPKLKPGSPKITSRGTALKAGVISCALTHFPSEITNIMPLKMVMVPNVTTIDGMLNFQTRRPFSAPKKVPMPIAIKIKMAIGRSGAMPFVIATIIPDRARLAATERSMHFVKITIIWPMAKIIRGEVSLNTANNFLGSIKAGNRVAIKPSAIKIAAERMASRDENIDCT